MPSLGRCRCCIGPVSNEARSCPRCGQPDPYDDEWAEIALMYHRGQKLEAIKIVMEKKGYSFKDAMSFLSAL